jgi:hypothetical protein
MILSLRHSVVCQRKHLKNRRFLQERHAQNLQNSVEVRLDSQTPARDRYEQVNRHGAPDLGLHRVLRRTVKRLDPQVLFDPFEEQLDLPAAAVEVRDGFRVQLEVVGQEDQSLVVVGVVKRNPAQMRRITLPRIERLQHDRLVAACSGRLVGRMRIQPPEREVLPGAGDEECSGPRPAVEPLEVEVAAVHNVEGAGFGHEVVQEVDVVDFGRCYADKRGDIAAQVEQRVHLHGVLRALELRPGKERHAQVDDRGVQGVDRTVQFDAERFAGIERPRFVDQDLRKVGVNAPVATIVGVAERAARHPATNAQVVQPPLERLQAGDDVAQALAISQLGKCQAEKLVPTREGPCAMVATIARHALAKLVDGQVIDELGENGSSAVHARTSQAAERARRSRIANRVSNR